jgi:hypothetical protein
MHAHAPNTNLFPGARPPCSLTAPLFGFAVALALALALILFLNPTFSIR